MSYAKIDDGNWESNRLNEMIILTSFESLPFKVTEKSNQILTALICDLKNFNVD